MMVSGVALQEPLFLEAHVASCEVDVVLTRRQAPARVVVDQDEPQRRAGDGGLEDLAGVGPRRIEAPDGDRLPHDELVLGIEVQGYEMLLARPSQVLDLGVGLAGAGR